MTPRTFWDGAGNLWELSADGYSCWLLWHHEHGEEFVCLVSPEDRMLMVGCTIVDVAWKSRPLVATC